MSAGRGTPRVPPSTVSISGNVTVQTGALPAGTTPTNSNFVIPRTVEQASAALPGAGAFTSQAFSVIPLGTRRVTYWITYTRGAAGGFPALRAEVSNGTDQVNFHVLNAASLLPGTGTPVTSDFASLNFYREELLGPVPPDASAIDYELTFEVPPGTTGIRLLAAERGVTATPGTAAWAFTGGAP